MGAKLQITAVTYKKRLEQVKNSLKRGEKMFAMNHQIKEELLRLGADITGFGDLCGLPDEVRGGMPVGVSIAVVYPREVIRGIADSPTQAYADWYKTLNEKLDRAVCRGAQLLRDMGYQATAQTRSHVGNGEKADNTILPHKTVATRAGIGWIGKSALLVTEQYGSAIRLSSILTDAPLQTAVPADRSRCGSCTACTAACPAKAISGRLWEIGMQRDELLDPAACRKTARERARQSINAEITICGKCIEICPYTRGYTLAASGAINTQQHTYTKCHAEEKAAACTQ